MGTKNYSSYSDLITFSRASSGTALAKISYGPELVTATTPDFLQNATASGLTVTSDGTSPCRASFTLSNLTIGSVYLVTCAVTNTIAVFWDNAETLAGSVQTLINESANNYIVASATTMYLGFKEFSPSLGQEFVFSNVSVKEVLFDQPDGTLQLFNHPTNQPRVEYDYQGNRLGLLVEEARTNLVTYSDFSTNWAAIGATRTYNAATSPDGTSNSTLVQLQNTSGAHVVESFINPIVSGASYAFSLFAKKGTSRYIALGGSSAGNICAWAVFDLETGTITEQTVTGAATLSQAKCVEIANGFFRCSIVVTLPATSCYFSMGVVTNATPTIVTWAGEQYTALGSETVFVYGAQAEAGTFPTSYIPTSGATATRSADVASIGVGAFGYNKGAGTVLVEYDRLSASINADVIMAATNSHFNASSFGIHGSSPLSGYVRANSAYVGQVIVGSPGSETTKSALGFGGDNILGCTDGGTVTANSSLSGYPTTVTEIEFMNVGVTGQRHSGHIKNVAYYPRRLTDAQIKALTSPPETPTLSLTFDDSTTSYLETSIHG